MRLPQGLISDSVDACLHHVLMYRSLPNRWHYILYIHIYKLNYIVQIHTHILVLVCILCIQLSAQGWVTLRVSSTCRNDRLQTTATATTTNKLQIQQQDEAESQQAQLTLIRLSLVKLFPSSSDLCLMTTTKLPTFRSISICLFSGQFDFFFFLFFFCELLLSKLGQRVVVTFR